MKSKLTPRERIALVEKALKGESVTKIAREYGISRVLLYRWLKRYKDEGHQGLKPQKSGRPLLHIRKPYYNSIRENSGLKPGDESNADA